MVVPAAGGRFHPYAGDRLHSAGRALDHEDDLDGAVVARQAVGRQPVAQAFRGASAVAPPAVGDRADDVGGVDDEQEWGSPRSAASMGQSACFSGSSKLAK